MIQKKNLEMMWVALKKGIDHKEVVAYIDNHKESFFVDLKTAAESKDLILRLLGLELSSKFIQQFDQKIEKLAQKTKVPKGLVLYALLNETKENGLFSHLEVFAKKKGLMCGEKLIDALVDTLEKEQDQKAKVSNRKKGRKAVQGKRV